eukprot:scaffold2.g6865.t1
MASSVVAKAFIARPSLRPARRTSVKPLAATALPAEVKQLTPVGDRVFVKVAEAEQKTTGGILLPSSAAKKPTQGEVATAGAAKAVKVGDNVVYSKYAGTEVQLQGTDYILLKEDDVIGTIRGDDISALRPLQASAGACAFSCSLPIFLSSQDRVLIEVVEAEDRTSGGLLLTEGAKEKPTMGKVVAVGPGKEGEGGKVVPPTVKVGSTVLYQKYSGTEFEGADDRQFIVVRDADILATLA